MPDNVKMAYLFPGQGSQKVGMGKDFYDKFDLAREIFAEADRALGFPLARLCFEGPEEELRQTINAQPAILTVSYIHLKVAQASASEGKRAEPVFMAGHSLGEYTALAASGSLTFADSVCLARERGRLMHEAGKKTPGAMAAILGMEEKPLAEICAETGSWIANLNSPGQLVISGGKEEITGAAQLAEARGARVVLLQVSGAFHTPLMQPAVEGLQKALNEVTFKAPRMPVIANTDSRPLTEPADIKGELTRQLTSAVQWQRSMEYMISQGVTTFIEIGPGKVLSGLMKRINRNMKALNISEAAEINNIAAQG